MYQTLYRKYRPKTFSDVCGQERITTVLRRQMEEGTLTHAYLFCGTRGTGKTTCAKILAKAANCLDLQNGEPCNNCDNCRAADQGELLDILEVDAASNTGVDNIRKLCEELNFMPAQGKKRVYIIDEVHMLSIGAFNALLKTLEEPPAHVLFILATTELHKVPATVRSRCQCFTFHRLSLDDITNRILYVSQKENIPIENSGARLVARLSDGAMRDALSLLELCVGHEGSLDDKTLDSLFGLGDSERIKDLAVASVLGDYPRALALLQELFVSMSDMKELLNQLLGAFRDMLMYSVGSEFETTSNRTLSQQNELKVAAKKCGTDKLLYAIGVLEETLGRFEYVTISKKAICDIAIIRVCTPALSASTDALLARIGDLERKIQNGASAPSAVVENPASVSEKPVEKEEFLQDEVPAAADPMDDLPWDTSGEDTPLAPIEQDAPAAESEEKSEKKTRAAKKAVSSDLAYADKLLKAIAAEDPFFSSFCTNLALEEKGNVLYIYGEPFTVTMLQSRASTFLEEARKFSPDLTSVQFVEGKPKTGDASDLGEF